MQRNPISALASDLTVEVIDGTVHINGVPQPTGAPDEHGRLQLARGWLLADRYALLGDHRDVTPDLAEHAVVGREDLVGRVVGHLSPPTFMRIDSR